MLATNNGSIKSNEVSLKRSFSNLNEVNDKLHVWTVRYEPKSIETSCFTMIKRKVDDEQKTTIKSRRKSTTNKKRRSGQDESRRRTKNDDQVKMKVDDEQKTTIKSRRKSTTNKKRRSNQDESRRRTKNDERGPIIIIVSVNFFFFFCASIRDVNTKGKKKISLHLLNQIYSRPFPLQYQW